MPFKSKAQARMAFAGKIPGVNAKEWAKKTNFSKIPDHVAKESLELGVADKKPEVTSGVKAPSPEVTSGVKAPKPEVVQAKESLELGNAKEKPEVTSGVKAPKPEVTSGVKAPKPEVTQATGTVTEDLDKGVAQTKPEVKSGVKAPSPEVTSGVKAPKPEVVQAKESLELGTADKKPEATSGVKAPSPEVKTGNKPEAKPEVTQADKMDEASETKHKALEEKTKLLKAEMEALEKEMTEVKELGVKKHIHNTKKEEVAKLGEEIKELKEKKKELPITPPHDGEVRKGNKHMPPATKTIQSKKWKAKNNKKGWKKDVKEFTESVKVLSENFSNSYLRKTSRENLISERVLSTYWEKAVTLQEKDGAVKNKGNKSFWYGVVKNFNSILNEEELNKAKSMMTEREKFAINTEKFINCLASDDYIHASNYISEMVNSSLANLIDSSKIQYQKELGEKVSKKIREV